MCPSAKTRRCSNRFALSAPGCCGYTATGNGLCPRVSSLAACRPGAARCLKAVPIDPDGYPESFSYNDATRTLHVGSGEFAPVDA